MNKDKAIFIFGIIVSLVVISVSGMLYYQNSKKTGMRKEEIVIIQTPEPTQKPQETVNYKNTEIQVLNGSGKAGLAKTYADKLEKLGYTKITTGNYGKIIRGNMLIGPTDFGKEINLENYKYQKSDVIKIILGN